MDPHLVRPEQRCRSAAPDTVETLPNLVRSEAFWEDLASVPEPVPQPVPVTAMQAAPANLAPRFGRRATDFLPPHGVAALPPRRPWGDLGLQSR